MTAKMQTNVPERELPMLAGIAAAVAWVEELLALLSGPLLTFGLGIALIDLLTDGKLLATQPALLYVWAISQAAGLDAQLVGSAAKLARAVRQRRGWAAVGYIVLVVALGYVAYLASNVFATQEADGISTAQALARLGMDSTSWIIQRSALSVALVVLSGVLRYVRPAVSSIADEQAKLERELTLEPLRQQLRVQQAGGVRAIANAFLGAKQSAQLDTSNAPVREQFTEEPSAPDPLDPPSGPGTPVAHPVESEETLTDLFPSATIETVAEPPAETASIEEPAPAVPVVSAAPAAPSSEPAADGNAERKPSVDADTKRTLAFGLMQEYPELRDNTARLIAELRTRVGEGVRHDTAATWQRQFKRSGAISTIADVRTSGTVRAVK